MLKLSERLRSTHNPDGAVVLDISYDKMFSLNPVGSRIIEHLRQGLTEIQITGEISREFRTDVETVRNDVREFLSQLEKHHLLATEVETETR
jgi:Coenzyme PQQ synthesis protein D (PqqD)